MHVECTWIEKAGYYVLEGHGTIAECYDTLQEAKEKCMTFQDCHAIATQSNVCEGKFRVSHGGPTFIYYTDWKSYSLMAWDHNCRGNKC